MTNGDGLSFSFHFCLLFVPHSDRIHTVRKASSKVVRQTTCFFCNDPPGALRGPLRGASSLLFNHSYSFCTDPPGALRGPLRGASWGPRKNNLKLATRWGPLRAPSVSNFPLLKSPTQWPPEGPRRVSAKAAGGLSHDFWPSRLRTHQREELRDYWPGTVRKANRLYTSHDDGNCYRDPTIC
jgi:hypothetical protein